VKGAAVDVDDPAPDVGMTRIRPGEEAGAMSWSIPLATVAGTTIRLHLTFLLLLAWVAALYGAEGGVAAALDGVLFICLVFLCVVLHEFGHIAAARWYGIRTPDITLLPIGGVARLERMPERPGREIVVALAGPAVNVVIAALLFMLLGARFDLDDMAQIEAAQLTLVGRLAAINALLVLFNMIPAFPTDGGRVLRALLAYRMGRVRATKTAAVMGQLFAGLFVIVGLMGNPFLALIGVFLFLAGGAESQEVSLRAAVRGLRVGDAMILRFESLGPHSVAEDASRLMLLTTQQEFPVLDDDGRLRGMVTREALIGALRETGPQTPVARFMATEVPMAQAGDPLDDLVDSLRASPSRTVAVADPSGRFLGYVSRENLAELMMVVEARAEARS
jgi:stage IV sporulation protein FB